MTAGDDALREAMKFEQARIYGRLCREHIPARIKVDRELPAPIDLEAARRRRGVA